jgi:hypothetical protein
VIALTGFFAGVARGVSVDSGVGVASGAGVDWSVGVSGGVGLAWDEDDFDSGENEKTSSHVGSPDQAKRDHIPQDYARSVPRLAVQLWTGSRRFHERVPHERGITSRRMVDEKVGQEVRARLKRRPDQVPHVVGRVRQNLFQAA